MKTGHLQSWQIIASHANTGILFCKSIYQQIHVRIAIEVAVCYTLPMREAYVAISCAN